MPSERMYDVVLLGATGFTGGLTAEYLAAHVPPGCRWAIAGRNAQKLDAVMGRLATQGAAVSQPAVEKVDIGDPLGMRNLANATRVLITTVGPYILHGDAAVAACAAAGTDYLDLTGEPEFVDQTYLRHHGKAVSTSARLVHAAGFDSTPHDLGVLHCVEQLPEGVPLTIEGHVRVAGRASSGTIQSFVEIMGRAPQAVRTARRRRKAEPADPARRVHVGSGGAPTRYDGAWALPFPSIDPQVVRRSAQALARYGPDFTYHHRLVVDHLSVGLAGAAGLSAAALAAQIPQARRAVRRWAPSGDGPSAERRAKSHFTVTFVGEGGGRRVVTRVSGGDPGYDETAKMLSEAALCLAFDENLPAATGQTTTAAAMGNALITRLQAAGITFELVSSTPSANEAIGQGSA